MNDDGEMVMCGRVLLLLMVMLVVMLVVGT